MAGTITHSWNGTVLTITSDSGTSSADLQGGKGDTGTRGPQGPAGIIVNPDGTIDTSQYATETYVNEKIAQVEAGSVDLSNYYTKTETDAKIAEAQLSGGEVDLSAYATQEWVNNKGYLTEHQSRKTINGESIVGSGNITISGGSTDLSNYYTKTEIDNKGFQTAAQVQTLIDNALGVIENGSY